MSLSPSNLRRLASKILPVTAAFCLLSLLWQAEPCEQNRPLSFWLAQFEKAPADRDPRTVDALCALHQPALDALHRRLVARDGPIRRILLRLANSPGCPSLRVSDSDRRRTAAAVVVESFVAEPAAFTPDLTEALGLSRGTTGEETIRRALVKVGMPAIPCLLAMLADPQESRRHGAILALNAWMRARGVPRDWAPHLACAAGAQLRSSSIDLVLDAIPALGLLGENALVALPSLQGGLCHADPRVRTAAALALGAPAVRVSTSVPCLAVLLKDPVDEVRSTAATVLGHFGPGAAEAVPVLVEAARDASIPVAVAAVSALGRIGPRAASAGPTLLESLRGSTPVVRASCASALGRIGFCDESVVAGLAGALSDSDEYVRRDAARALRAYGPGATPALPALIGALHDPSESIRVYVVEALGLIGSPARSAVPFLEAARNNNQSVMNPPVVMALARIQGGTMPRSSVP